MDTNDNVIYLEGPSVKDQLITAGIGILATLAMFAAFLGFGALVSGVEALKEKRRLKKIQKAEATLAKEKETE